MKNDKKLRLLTLDEAKLENSVFQKMSLNELLALLDVILEVERFSEIEERTQEPKIKYLH